MHVHMQHTQRFGSFFMYFLLTFLVDFLWPVEIEKINEFFFLTELRKMHFSDEGRCAYPGALAINFWCFKNYLQHTFGMHVVTVWTGHLVVKSSSFRFCAICRVCKWLEKLRREREIEREEQNEWICGGNSFIFDFEDDKNISCGRTALIFEMCARWRELKKKLKLPGCQMRWELRKIANTQIYSSFEWDCETKHNKCMWKSFRAFSKVFITFDFFFLSKNLFIYFFVASFLFSIHRTRRRSFQFNF